MYRRFSTLSVLAAILPVTLTGCGESTTPPVGVQTVRLAVVPGAKHGGAPFMASMTQEVFHTPVTWLGDADGTGSALITVNRGQGEVCWDISVSDIALPATSAHIHQAEPDFRGPIVVPLSAPDNSGRASGCASGVDRELMDAIVDSPASFYVNVHNSPYPMGAVRGQLSR